MGAQLLPGFRALATGECHVWWATAGQPSHLGTECLDETERARHARMPAGPDRDLFVVGCALAKRVLAGYAGVPVHEVRFDRRCAHCGGPHGKPRWQPPASRPALNHSVSHSSGLAVVAVSLAGPVGVDVQAVPATLDAARMSRLILADQERAAVRGVPAEQLMSVLTRYWVWKEAVLKATGDGLRIRPGAVAFAASASAPRLVAYPGRGDVVRRSVVRRLDPGPGYEAAVCVLGDLSGVAQFDGDAMWEELS